MWLFWIFCNVGCLSRVVRNKWGWKIGDNDVVRVAIIIIIIITIIIIIIISLSIVDIIVKYW